MRRTLLVLVILFLPMVAFAEGTESVLICQLRDSDEILFTVDDVSWCKDTLYFQLAPDKRIDLNTLHQRAFVFKLDGKPVFDGVFHDQNGQAPEPPIVEQAVITQSPECRDQRIPTFYKFSLDAFSKGYDWCSSEKYNVILSNLDRWTQTIFRSSDSGTHDIRYRERIRLGERIIKNDPDVVWRFADTGGLLFTSEDIIRFDWERQIFELRESVVTRFWNFRPWEGQRGLNWINVVDVMDDRGKICSWRLSDYARECSVTETSWRPSTLPVVLQPCIPQSGTVPFVVDSEKTRLYQVHAPGGLGGSVNGSVDWRSPRLREALEKSGKLAVISDDELLKYPRFNQALPAPLKLSWCRLGSDEVIFDIDDIVRFDWDRMVFELDSVHAKLINDANHDKYVERIGDRILQSGMLQGMRHMMCSGSCNPKLLIINSWEELHYRPNSRFHWFTFHNTYFEIPKNETELSDKQWWQCEEYKVKENAARQKANEVFQIPEILEALKAAGKLGNIPSDEENRQAMERATRLIKQSLPWLFGLQPEILR